MIIPIFVPHKGCPNDCIFCNQKKISGQIEEMTTEKIPYIIEMHLSTKKPGDSAEIAFYGGSFTAIDQAVQEDFLKTAYQYVQAGKVSEIRISTRPDSITREILKRLKLYGVSTVELGVQSLDDEVLSASCRGHNAECVFRSSDLVKSQGLKLGIQTMTGLPKDTDEKCLETARKVISIAPDFVRIYPVLVIKGTALETQFLGGTYIPHTLEEAVELCSKLLELYESNGISVIRIGLQASENIREGSMSDVLAGPVHPAFRQLVEAKLMLGHMIRQINEKRLSGVQCLNILTGSSNISNVNGHKKSNLKYLYDHYSFKKIHVIPDDKLLKEIICSGS